MIWWRGFLNKLLIRACDIIFSSIALIILFPVIIVIGIIILSNSPGGIFFSQSRVGKNGSDFRLFKFRTMHLNSDRHGLITVGSKDPRITRSGLWLRKFKLDEIPQLLNVLRGEMSLVGPRPEVKKYTEQYSPAQQMIILSIRPGITDYASIAFSRENEMLQKVNDPEKLYVDEIMPAKLNLNLLYIENYTFGNYLRVIFKTFWKLMTHL